MYLEHIVNWPLGAVHRRKIIPLGRKIISTRSRHNPNFHQQGNSIHMSWRFPRLTEISPPADRDLDQAGNIYSYECIFPAEWDKYINTLFTKNIKILLFCLDISNEDILKVFSCLWIPDVCRTSPKTYNERTKPWYGHRQKNRANFFQVCVSHFKHWFPAKFSRLTPHQNKSRPAGEIIHIWRQGNNIYFPG